MLYSKAVKSNKKGKIKMRKKRVLKVISGSIVNGIIVAMAALGNVIAYHYYNYLIGALVYGLIYGIGVFIYNYFFMTESVHVEGKVSEHIVDVLIGFFVSLLTIGLLGNLIRFSIYGDKYGATVDSLIEGKMSAHPLSVIGLAIVTGLCIGIMKLAIKGTKKKSHHYLITFVIAFAYVAMGSSPYISELMYISLSHKLFTGKGILHLLLLLAGNYIGLLLTLPFGKAFKEVETSENAQE